MPQTGASVLPELTFAAVMVSWLELSPGGGTSLVVLLVCVGLVSPMIALAARLFGSSKRPSDREV